MLSDKCVVLGVTGGIAAYKAVEIVSRLKKMGLTVDVVMTHSAAEFVTPLTFETISGRPVTVDMFQRPERWEVEHVALAQKADVMVVAPATANIIAKLCHGIADDMLSTTLLATKAPVLLAPAMNTGMWDAVPTCQNVQTLRERGIHFVGPDSGLLACGDIGAGRMSEPEAVVQATLAVLSPKRDMAGLRVLVTAGSTRERLDPVRYLTNDSSGKMGYALAAAAAERGAEVVLVSGAVTQPPPANAQLIPVESTQNLYDVMMRHCEMQDIIIQAAAPADYRFAAPSDQKIKKQAGAPLCLEMIENPDVAKAVGERKQKGQVLVGFAAETENLVENAKKKLQSKRLDLVVANDVTMEGAGFGVDTNIATLVSANGEKCYPKMQKRALADLILDEALLLRKA